MKFVEQNCNTCQKPFMAQAHWVEKGKGKYCSHKCVPIWNKGIKGSIPWNKGKKTDQLVWNKGLKMTEEQKSKLNMTGLKIGLGYFKGKHNIKIQGKNHWRWKGGISKTSREARNRDMNKLEYKLWRDAVYQRDDYACVNCGDNTSGNLQADHIKPWSLFPELRYAIDNGQTLCLICHKEKTKVDMTMYFNQKFKEAN